MNNRDFINIGVFSAVYYVILFAFGMLGIIAVPMMFVGFALGILANGVVIALFKARVPKIGALALLGLLVGLLTVLTGHPWISAVVTPLLGLAADFLYARAAKPLGYAVLSLLYTVPWLPVLWDQQRYLDYVASSMGNDYAESLSWFLSPTMILAWTVCVFILGLVGGFFGESLLKRHFAKSGIAK